MIKVLTIFIIVYAVSLAFMTTVITIAKTWDEDYVALAVFAPVINTLVFCVGIFYIIPQQIIEQRNEKIKQQHKHDPRWNLMNSRKK